MLNQYQIEFCEGVLSGASLKEAYLAAYNTNSPTSAQNAASLLVRNPEVQQYLAGRRKEMQERTAVTHERTLLELARVAYSDIREFVSWGEDGTVFVPSSELTQDQAAAIASVKVKRRIHRDKEGEETETIDMEIKTHSKMDALEKLAKVQGLYQADRMNDIDAKRDMLKTVLWRWVMAVHTDKGITIPEALALAQKDPEEVERWGKEVMMALPAR